MFAGLVALKMSEPGNVYGFGRDITQYQQLVKNYYTVGYNGRNRALHPPGSWYRPGTYAPVAWNGLDGSQSTICPLSWPPNGALKKRDTTDPATSPDICAAYSYHSVIIYSRAEKSCLDSSEPICSFEYFLYAVSNPSDTPSDICNGAGFIGSAAESFPSNSISFNLPKNSGDSANENLDFLYTWTMDDVSGWVTGDDLTAPVACVEETSNLSLVQTCALKEYDSAQRRAIVPIPEPPDVAYVYAGFASCVWGSD